MNCRQGDLAFIRTTHPLVRLHGLLVRCLEADHDPQEGPTWHFIFMGGKQLSDEGVFSEIGVIQDRYLVPINAPPLVSHYETTGSDDHGIS